MSEEIDGARWNAERKRWNKSIFWFILAAYFVITYLMVVGLTRLREPAGNNFFSLLKGELTYKQQVYLYAGDNQYIWGKKTKIQQAIIIY